MVKAVTAEELPQQGPPSIPTAEYNTVVEAANLDSVVLLQSEFQMDPNFLRQAPADRKLTLNLAKIEVGLDEAAGVGNGTFQWEVIAKGDHDQQLLRVSATFVVVYVGLLGRDKKAVEAFIGRVGRFTVFPYFRTFVSQMSWLSGAGLPIVPILRDPKSPTPSEIPPPQDGDPDEE
jgi:hypothetical protein